MARINLPQMIQRCNTLGIPFVYEGVEYEYQPVLFSPKLEIGCNLVDPNAVSDSLRLLGGVKMVNLMSNPRLKHVWLPKSVVQIGTEAFLDAATLETVTIQKDSQLKMIDPRAFQGCRKLHSINLQDALSLRIIGSQAFQECVSLREIWLPSNLSEVMYGAFHFCDSLQAIHLSRHTFLTASFPKTPFVKTETRRLYYD